MVQSQTAVHNLVIISGSGSSSISGTIWSHQVKKCNIQENREESCICFILKYTHHGPQKVQ